jgi:hypothetical protein
MIAPRTSSRQVGRAGGIRTANLSPMFLFLAVLRAEGNAIGGGPQRVDCGRPVIAQKRQESPA